LGASTLAEAAELAAAALDAVVPWELLVGSGPGELLPPLLLLLPLATRSAEKLMQLPPMLHVTCTTSSQAPTCICCICTLVTDGGALLGAAVTAATRVQSAHAARCIDCLWNCCKDLVEIRCLFLATHRRMHCLP
jgi:hypothetical protein